MTTNGETTRNATYWDIEPQLSGKRLEVFRFIAAAGPGGVTREEIAVGLGWPINCVTGRVNELEEPKVDDCKRPDLGVVVTTDRTRKSAAGKSVAVIVAKKHLADAFTDAGNARIDAVVSYVRDGHQWVTKRQIVEDIAAVMQHSAGSKWPAGSASEYSLAVDQAVSVGRLKVLQGKIWINLDTPDVAKEVADGLMVGRSKRATGAACSKPAQLTLELFDE